MSRGVRKMGWITRNSDKLERLADRVVSRLARNLRHPKAGSTAPVAEVPDEHYYRPVFSPWLGHGDFGAIVERVSPFSLVSPDRLWTLRSLAKQARSVPGDFWECGVYKGGTAMLLESIVRCAVDKALYLFDTFAGMPETDPKRDHHRRGDFADTSLEAVSGRVGQGPHVHYRPGLIPETFIGLEGQRVAFAHVDVDIFSSVTECCRFIYPRLSPGGVMVFDDYGFRTCPGARQAVDAYFSDRPEVPLVLPTGQAVVFKLP